MVRTLIAGNWKMNGSPASLAVIEAIVGRLGEGRAADALICPPATLIAQAADAARGSTLAIGGQDCHAAESGAHTGDVAAEMLAGAGASHVILGHSERRADHHETDAIIAAKAEAALRAGLTPIVCVGESLEQREAGDTLVVIEAQLAGSLPDSFANAGFVVAYEPIWAIGTGKVADTKQIGEVHAAIRQSLAKRFASTGEAAPILYGGSMKPGNAAEILAVADVNGGLIGGASLKAEDFLAIYAAAS
ncbi:MAG: triose-phosphate isomerase [Pseudomonadota bacterium]